MNPRKASRSEKKGAKEILRLGLKVFAYRNDILSAEDKEELNSANTDLASQLKEKPVAAEALEKAAKRVDLALQKNGDLYYHKKSWVENVEMLLVAAIVVIGIRSFFVQPFIIPTNSMYPSFFGMQPKVYQEDERVPNIAERAIDKILLGASHFRLESESKGKLYLKLHNGAPFRFVQGSFPHGRFFILPNSLREYIFEIGGKDHPLLIPAEFDLDELLAKKFAGTDDLRDLPLIVTQDHGFMGNRLKLSDKIIQKGEIAFAFDILLGDALFVDRMSYNFITPKSGDPAVFRTGSIDEFNRKLQMPVRPIGEDKYYIKRLVGEPGDTLEMKVPDSIFTNGTDLRKGVPGVLYRNSKPISGKSAFEENRKTTEALAINSNTPSKTGYPGYRAEGLLTNKSLLHVPDRNSSNNPTNKKAFFAMGDNSTDSLDGRSWGFVPENEIIGKAWFVYYPFTKRWGFSD